MRREHPILFSGPMVRAIIDGRKTQTRRVVNPQPPAECSIRYMLGNESWIEEGKRTPLRHSWEAWHGPLFANRSAKALAGTHTVRCPYGQPGDTLWVRETWRADLPLSECTGPEDLRYAASVDEAEWAINRWRPSIHMSRWASRLTLRVTDVRVQRLQEISEGDAAAEGILCLRCGLTLVSHCRCANASAHFHKDFAHLWDSINGKRAPWASNPFVWSLSFERVTG